MRQSIEAAYLTRAFVTRTHEYAFRKGSCDSLVIGLTVLSNVEKREVEMGVEAEPQKLSGEEIIEWSKRYTLAALFPGDIEKSFFTFGGAEANENAIRIAKAVTGRNKILARYRSYHGATSGAITLTGDPRRWANEPGIPGVVHVLDFYHGTERPMDSAEKALAQLRETIELEGPETIAAFILEPVTGPTGSPTHPMAICRVSAISWTAMGSS